MSQERLTKKVVLVTGAAQGIGKEAALVMSREGAQVIVSDINDAAGLLVADEIGNGCQYLHLDVQEENEWQKAMDQILTRFGKLNVLVNNAGITGFQEGFGPQDPEHASLDSWLRVHAVNMNGVFLGCKYGIQAIKQAESGSIINISSRSGLVGIPGAAAYASSKAAVRNHTKSVALYCCQQGYHIRCNSIHPAAILTPMWEPMLGNGPERETRMAGIAKDIPMQRMGTANDVANAILFLASDESKYLTGIELTVDGGILAGSCAVPQKIDL
ncbi:MAG: short-chain dehydrogenase [Parachlamydia sp.]|nr:MAG: short-chain dehydrogenase [Parachlamydia sp.]